MGVTQPRSPALEPRPLPGKAHYAEFDPVQLDLGEQSDEIRFHVAGYDWAIVQLTDIGSVTHTGNTVSVLQSMRGETGIAFGTAVTFTTADGISALLAVTALGYLHVKVTTVGSGAGRVWVHVGAMRSVV